MSGPDARIPLGAFDLERRAARGGMAEVWHGAHRASGLPVAVKVILRVNARDPVYLSAFRNEVRAVAGLDHPAIVHVLDFGELPASIEAATEGTLAAGSPYLVMERLSGGSLADRLAQMRTWDEISRTLRTILAALGHAHARGVVHRDLNPRNVLVGERGDLRRGLVLADFGLAFAAAAADPLAAKGEAAGTPQYMAPEQFDGAWRDWGPWTDLYSLGCLAHALATGAPPFPSPDYLALRRAHRDDAPPKASLAGAPERFSEWTARLLAKRPHDRFLSAAEAVTALGALENPRHADSVPEDWRETSFGSRPVEFLDAGLGLFGLKTPPVIARESERDVLWRALRDVEATGRAQFVALTGPAGTGKSRLADWLSHRAHELAGIRTVRAVHNPFPSPGDGLGGMLATILGTRGLPRAAAESRIGSLVASTGIEDEYEAPALTELVHPASPAEERAGARIVRTRSAHERHALLRRAIEREAGGRALLWIVEDAHFGAAALDFASALLESQERTPLAVLVVATVQDESLPGRREADKLAALARNGQARQMEIGPLTRAEQTRLLRSVLPLENALAARTAEATGGSPLFAVQLLSEWVGSGALVPTSEGFVLRPGVSAAIPNSMLEMSRRRLDAVLADSPASERSALELAATFGVLVDGPEWTEACRLAEADASQALIERLLAERILRPADGGFTFAHALFCESLVRSAEAGGRVGRHHAVCAAVLGRRCEEGNRQLAERVGRHLSAAGNEADAVNYLLEGLRQTEERADFAAAAAGADDLIKRLDRLGVAADDVRRGRAWLIRATCAANTGHLDEGLRWAAQAEALGRAGGHPEIVAAGLESQARTLVSRGDFGAARPLFEDAVAVLAAKPDSRTRHNCLLGIAAVERARGDLARSLEAAAASLAEAERNGLEEIVVRALYEQCVSLVTLGRTDEAAQIVPRTEALCRRRNETIMLASVLNLGGEIARRSGDWDRAVAAYTSSLEMLRRYGSGDDFAARLNLSLALLHRGDLAASRALALEVLGDAQRQGRRGEAAFAHMQLAAVEGTARNGSESAANLERSLAIADELGIADPDLAELAERVGGLDSLPDAARRSALGLAHRQYRALGRDADVGRIVSALASPHP